MKYFPIHSMDNNPKVSFNLEFFFEYRHNEWSQTAFLKRVADKLGIEGYERFKFCYYFVMTYSVCSAYKMYKYGCLDKSKLYVNKDRRAVHGMNLWQRELDRLSPEIYNETLNAKSIAGLYKIAESVPGFGDFGGEWFVKTMVEVYGLKVDENDIRYFWSTPPVKKGMELLYQEMYGEEAKDEKDLNKGIMELCRRDNPVATPYGIMANLCAFPKLIWGTRGLNSYYFRHWREITMFGYEDELGDLMLEPNYDFINKYKMEPDPNHEEMEKKRKQTKLVTKYSTL